MTREEAIKVLMEERLYEVEHEGDSPKGEALKMAISALRAQQERKHDPLTLEELRDMRGQWVWVTVQYENCTCDGWAMVCPTFLSYLEQTIPFDFYGKKAVAYRRRPEEE